MGRTGARFEQKSPPRSDEDAVVGFNVSEYHPLCEAVGRSTGCEEFEAGDRRVVVRSLRPDAGENQSCGMRTMKTQAANPARVGRRAIRVQLARLTSRGGAEHQRAGHPRSGRKRGDHRKLSAGQVFAERIVAGHDSRWSSAAF